MSEKGQDGNDGGDDHQRPVENRFAEGDSIIAAGNVVDPAQERIWYAFRSIAPVRDGRMQGLWDRANRGLRLW